ncbi:hypothetical protein Peur_043474 [Populus x canadensis]
MQVVMAKKRHKKSMNGRSCRHGNYRDTQERGAPQIPWVPGLHSNHRSLILGESSRQSNGLSSLRFL